MTFSVTKSPTYLAGKLLFEKRHEFFVVVLFTSSKWSPRIRMCSMRNQLRRPDWAGLGCLDSGVFDRPAFSGHVFSWFLEHSLMLFKKPIFLWFVQEWSNFMISNTSKSATFFQAAWNRARRRKIEKISEIARQWCNFVGRAAARSVQGG